MEKVHGDQFYKMTETPVPNLIINLAIPSVISMLINNVYNLVDTAFVGKLGTSASGAIGIVFGFMSIIQAFAFMFGQGSGSILSRQLGQKDIKKAEISGSVGFFGALISGILITGIGLVFRNHIVYWLGSTDTIAPYANTYIIYILFAAPFMATSLTMNNILRYEGKSMLGMVGLMSGAVLNMVLDPIFMFGLNMGISGAGLATALSQFISFLILLSMFLRKKTEVKIRLKSALIGGIAVLYNICATGFPSLLRNALSSLTTVLLNSQCRMYGDAAVAGMSIVSRIVFFTFSIAIGLGQGLQPVSAFNYGAGKYQRVREAFRFVLIIAEVIMIVSCSFLIIFSGDLVAIFRDDPAVIEVGARALRLQAFATMTLPLAMMTEMLYQSTGRRLGATFLSAIRNGLLFIPVLIALSTLRGLSGIEEAQPISIVLSVPVAIIFAINFFKTLPN